MRSARFCIALLLALPACARANADATTNGDAPAAAIGEKVSGDLIDTSDGGATYEIPRGNGAPVVDLSGVYHAPQPLRADAPRVAAIALETHVYAEPDTHSARAGVLRAGAIVEIDPKPVSGPGCANGFRAIKPVGFVCIGPEATLNLEHPIVKASLHPPDASQKLPYMYGTCQGGGPAYASLPSTDELKSYEPHLPSHIQHWAHDKESGAQYGQDLWMRYEANAQVKDPLEAMREGATDVDIPSFLLNGGHVPNLSGLVSPNSLKAGEFVRHNGVAFMDTFLWQGRRYGLSTDLRVMPTDRFRPIRGSDFHGVVIGKDIEMPFAFVRAKNQKRYRMENGHLVSAGPAEWRGVVGLVGKKHRWNGALYDETTDGFLLLDEALSIVDPPVKFPGWANAGEKWVDINVTSQLLTAYEGTKAVYATLVSTGEAGLDDPKTTRSTLRGIFRIHTKYLAATMDSKVVGEEFELRDVPYVQYFQNGYALHAAYWHDVFGQPKSHGCINLAPEDARRIFFWTEPQVPQGWHGAAQPLKGSVVFIHA